MMRDRCTTIDDAWNYFDSTHLVTSPLRTRDELRDYIHAKGLRYEELDGKFWDELFESGWHLGED
jgi:hypothetical protein